MIYNRIIGRHIPILNKCMDISQQAGSKRKSVSEMTSADLTVLEPYCKDDMRLLKKLSKSIFLRLNEPHCGSVTTLIARIKGQVLILFFVIA